MVTWTALVDVAVTLTTSTTPMDQPPTVLFESYEQDFRHVIDSVRQKLEGDAKSSVGGE